MAAAHHAIMNGDLLSKLFHMLEERSKHSLAKQKPGLSAHQRQSEASVNGRPDSPAHAEATGGRESGLGMSSMHPGKFEPTPEDELGGLWTAGDGLPSETDLASAAGVFRAIYTKEDLERLFTSCFSLPNVVDGEAETRAGVVLALNGVFFTDDTSSAPGSSGTNESHRGTGSETKYSAETSPADKDFTKWWSTLKESIEPLSGEGAARRQAEDRQKMIVGSPSKVDTSKEG